MFEECWKKKHKFFPRRITLIQQDIYLFLQVLFQATCFTCFHTLSVARNINMVKRSNNKIERRGTIVEERFEKKGKVACIASIFPHAMIMQSGEWLSKSVGATPGTWWVLTSTLNDELQAYGQSPER